MLNWTCTRCATLNPPRRSHCWQCDNGRFPATTSATPTSTWARLARWPLWQQFPRLIGAVGLLILTVGLFLPWVVHIAPSSEPQFISGVSTRYGQATALITLLLLPLILQNKLRVRWYVLAFLLAVCPIFLAPLPAQIMQVFDAVGTSLAGTETAEAISFFGIGVSVVFYGSVIIIIAASLHIIRASHINTVDESEMQNLQPSAGLEKMA